MHTERREMQWNVCFSDLTIFVKLNQIHNVQRLASSFSNVNFQYIDGLTTFLWLSIITNSTFLSLFSLQMFSKSQKYIQNFCIITNNKLNMWKRADSNGVNTDVSKHYYRCL